MFSDSQQCQIATKSTEGHLQFCSYLREAAANVSGTRSARDLEEQRHPGALSVSLHLSHDSHSREQGHAHARRQASRPYNGSWSRPVACAGSVLGTLCVLLGGSRELCTGALLPSAR